MEEKKERKSLVESEISMNYSCLCVKDTENEPEQVFVQR